MPRKTSTPDIFTNAFLKKLAVPKGATKGNKPRKDIVIFEPRSGLGVRKQAETGVTSFLIQLRLPDGRRWRETLRPPWPHLSLADARRALQVRTGDIAVGLDPFVEREEAAKELEAKRAERAALKQKAVDDQFTLRVLMRRWDHHALVHRRRSYAVRALRAIELTFPALMDKPVAEIDRKTVRAAVDAALDQRGRAAAIMAASAMRTLFRWAKKNDLVDTDIMLNFALPSGAPPRERTLNEDEARRVFRAAGVIGYPSGSFIQLLLLTGARRDEIRRLRWSEIVEDEIEGVVIDLPAERTKQGRTSGGHKIYLSPAALGVIADCPRHQGCPFVFTSDGWRAQGDVVRIKAKLDALLKADGGQPMKPWVFHDFRRSLVSGLAKRGHSPIALDLLLGHKPTGLSAIARIYQTNTFAPERVKALDQWGQIVTEPPKVTTLSAAKRKASM